jgi:hypothetical protein
VVLTTHSSIRVVQIRPIARVFEGGTFQSSTVTGTLNTLSYIPSSAGISERHVQSRMVVVELAELMHLLLVARSLLG